MFSIFLTFKFSDIQLPSFKSMAENIDIYRDTAVRYLGYTNEVGESFRPLIHVNLVRLSYGIASAYVVADTIDKSIKISKRQFDSDRAKQIAVTTAAADALIWQSFASVIIPGFTINRICAGSLYVLKHTTKLPKITRKWITTAVGLSSIPFIIKPIDHAVDYVMDSSFRKWVQKIKAS